MLTLKLFGKYQNRQMLNQIEETRRTLDDINSKIHTLKCEFEIIAEGLWFIESMNHRLWINDYDREKGKF